MALWLLGLVSSYTMGGFVHVLLVIAVIGAASEIGRQQMNAIRLAAIALIAAGVLALAYGGFTYTQDTQRASVGPIQISVQDRRTVNVPVWAGVAAIAVGAALLLMQSRKS